LKVLIFLSLFLIGSKVLAESFRLGPELVREVSSTSDLNNGIISLGFINSTCTGSIISKKGHVLTARHCIESVLSWAQIRNPKAIYIETQELGPGLNKYRYLKHDLFDLGIPMGLDERVVYGFDLISGPGNLSPRFTTPRVEKEHKALAEVGYSAGGDFAILRVPALIDRPCRKVGHQKLSKKARIEMISYGCYKPENGPSNQWPIFRKGEISLLTPTKGVPHQSGFWIPKGNLVAEIEAVVCNSGSPVLDKEDNVVGVLHTTFENKSGDSFMMGITITRIFELIDEDHKSILMDLNQSCNL